MKKLINWKYSTLAIVAALTAQSGCNGSKKFDEDLSAAGAAGSAQSGCPTACPQPKACEPNAAIACQCGSAYGVSQCLADGSGYGVCQCGPANTAGSAGSAPQDPCNVEPRVCDRGETEACKCTDGRDGSQYCDPNTCSGWLGCSCTGPLPGTGGSSGTGGSAGSSGTGGSAGSSTGGSAGTSATGGSGGTAGAGGSNVGGTAGSAGLGGSAGSESDAGDKCVPGKQGSCACGSDPDAGIRQCSNDGVWEACDCSMMQDAGADADAEAEADAATLCEPQQAYSCFCGNGIWAKQWCTADGMSFLACQCPDGGVGGAGGTGGSGGSSGAGGSLGTGGTSATGGSGGAAYDVVTVDCDVTYPDNAPSDYYTYVSDEGIGSGSSVHFVSQTHVTWGNDGQPYTNKNVKSSHFSFSSGNGHRIIMNTAINPEPGNFWAHADCKSTPSYAVLVKYECFVTKNGDKRRVAWPVAVSNNQQSCNTQFYAQWIQPTAQDEDGDGSLKGADCNDNDYLRCPNCIEVENDGIDNDCYKGDRQWVRILMDGPNSLGTPMYATDWLLWVPMSFDSSASKWATEFLPTSRVPKAFLVQYGGMSGSGCDGSGNCWDCSRNGNVCQPVYAVTGETTEHKPVAMTLGVVGNQCRRQWDPVNQ